MYRIFLPILLFFVSALVMDARVSSRLDRRPDGSACLMVDGKPYLVIGGETGNSMASSAEDVEKVMNDAVAHGYNTVLIPMTWELIEPDEGAFDFTSVDVILSSARRHGLKVVPLWFGVWKNSMSCYAPEWFKRDTSRFPRAMTRSGKPLEIGSAFSRDVYEADARAFRALLRHIADTDVDGTVIMLQIENEIGMLEDARDHSAPAESEYRKGVPSGLMKFLKENKSTLHPSLLDKWKAHGMKMSGQWNEVFGDDLYTDELFQAYNYALYVDRLAREARKILPQMPLYVNAAMNSRGRQPGQYPSGGPLANLKDMWHAGAPTVDMLSPDIYDSGFTSWMASYALPDNPLFVPEIKAVPANATQAYYIVGEYGAVGLCPFAYNNRPVSDVAYQYDGNIKLRSLGPLLFGKRDESAGRSTSGLYFDADSTTRTIVRDGLSIKASHYFTLPWDPRAADGSVWPATGGLLLRLAPMDYLIAGSGLVVTFAPDGKSADESVSPQLGEDGFMLTSEGTAVAENTDVNSSRIGLASVEEVEVLPDGTFKRLRTLNGDETHQGRHVRIGVDEFKILHVKLYKY